MRPNLVSYKNFAQKVGNFVDNCQIRLDRANLRWLGVCQMGYCFTKKTVLGDSKRSEFGRKSEEDKVGNSGYFSAEHIAVGYDDPIWAVAIETDRPEGFKEWSVFDFEDDTKKDGNNLDISIKKKKKKLLQLEPVELVVPRLEGAKKDS